MSIKPFLTRELAGAVAGVEDASFTRGVLSAE